MTRWSRMVGTPVMAISQPYGICTRHWCTEDLICRHRWPLVAAHGRPRDRSAWPARRILALLCLRVTFSAPMLPQCVACQGTGEQGRKPACAGHQRGLLRVFFFMAWLWCAYADDWGGYALVIAREASPDGPPLPTPRCQDGRSRHFPAGKTSPLR